MRYVELGGRHLSRIGLGTWQFGSPEWGYRPDYARGEAQSILRRALGLGVNVIDTAEAYGFGRSERIIGSVLDDRDRVFLATKLWPVAPFAPVVAAQARASARRLGTDHLDLYQLHWPNPAVPLSVTMSGLRRLRDSGLVREIGVSNYPLHRWRAAEEALGRPVVSDQVAYSLVARAPEEDLLGYAETMGRLVIAYSPLAQGFLAATYGPDRRPGGMRAANPLFSAPSLASATPLFETLREVAAGRDATPAQVALAWVLRRPRVVAIPGASSVEQLESNVAAADLVLRPDEVAALTGAAEQFRPLSLAGIVARRMRPRLGR